MKLIISTIVVGIVLFAIGGLFYALLFADFFKTSFPARGAGDMKLFAVGSMARAFFLYLIYSKGYQGGSPMAEGFKFGVLVSLFYIIPLMLFTWGGAPVKYQAVAVDGALQFVMMMIAAVLTAIIHGRGSKPAQTT